METSFVRIIERTYRVLALLVLALLSACGKTVTWEQEVPLNSGEVIWVERIVEYKLQGDSGNPLDMAYRPDWTETLKFTWQGREYLYTGDADIMLIAISPITKKPVLTASAALRNWDRKNDFRCTVPYYVQLEPDANGRAWKWKSQLESWIYEMPANIMLHRPTLDNVKVRYTDSERAVLDAGLSPFLLRVDPKHKFDGCRK